MDQTDDSLSQKIKGIEIKLKFKIQIAWKMYDINPSLCLNTMPFSSKRIE